MNYTILISGDFSRCGGFVFKSYCKTKQNILIFLAHENEGRI